MKCAAFERELPDWTMERMTPELARQMKAHCAQCPACQEKTRDERLLQKRWQTLPAPALLPEMGPRLRGHLAAASSQRHSRDLRGKWVSGLAVAAGLCFLLIRTHFPETPAIGLQTAVIPGPKIADENSLALRVEKMRATPAEENDSFLAETQQHYQEQRMALLGKDAP